MKQEKNTKHQGGYVIEVSMQSLRSVKNCHCWGTCSVTHTDICQGLPSGSVNHFLLSGCMGVQIEQSVMALKKAMALEMVLCRNIPGILRVCCKTQSSLKIKFHKFIIKLYEK